MSAVQELRPKLDEIRTRYPADRQEAALLPALHLLQDRLGHLPEGDLRELGEYLDIPYSTIAGVVTFYPMFFQEKRGKYHIHLCRTLSCELLGNRAILEALKKRLGIEVGETTEDGLFTLSWAECIGSCGTAPAMLINDQFYENLTPGKAVEVIDKLSK